MIMLGIYRPKVRNLIAIAALVVLAGCESLTGPGGIFGEDLAPPLEGERISILLNQRSLSPSPELADTHILLPAPTPNTSWPQAGGYANHAMHHITVSDNLNILWQADAGAGATDEVRLVGSPVVSGGRVFAMDSASAVAAFDAKTGKQLWRAALTPKEEEGDDHIGGGLAYENGVVYATTGFAQVIAINAANGDIVWRKQVVGPMRAAPTVRSGRVFAITVDSRLYALDAKDGSEIWSYSGISEISSLLGGASPAVDAGVVVAPFSSGELIALKAENGRILWSDSLSTARRTDVVSTMAHIRGRPIIDRGRVFAVSHGGLMVSIDLRSGRRIWQKEIGGLASPWVAGDYIFMLTNDSEIAAISREDGRVFWVHGLAQFDDPKTKDRPIVWSGPLLASDRLIVAGSNGEVQAISPYNGKYLGKIVVPSGVSVPPVIADQTVFFLSDNASLIAYR